MRSLATRLESVSQLELEFNDRYDDVKRAQCLCLDPDGRAYVATDAAAVVALPPPNAGARPQQQQQPLKPEWRVQLLPTADAAAAGSPAPRVVALTYVIELDAVFAALLTGELLLVDAASRAVDEAGFVEGGVVAAAWSPDGGAVAIVGAPANDGGGRKLLLLSRDWDVLGEVVIPVAEEEEEPASSSGGGDTGAGDASDPAAAAAAAAAEVRISWRGDGQYFATSTARGGSNGARRIHIWAREGCALHAVAEASAGLLPALAWQPNGRHLYTAATVDAAAAAAANEAIAGALAEAAEARVRSAGADAAALAARLRSSSNTGGSGDGSGSTAAAAAAAAGAGAAATVVQRVLLYERNGLQHGGFNLPDFAAQGDSSGVVRELCWSPDSELLAAVVGPPHAAAGGNGNGGCWRVQVWHRSNWHWYLKQELRFPHEPAACAGGGSNAIGLLVAWDETRPSVLHALGAGSGEYLRASFSWACAVSARGTAAVVDGADVLLTPLARCVVPPPSCAARARFRAPVNAVALADDDGEGAEAVAAVLADGTLAFVRAVEEDAWEETLAEQQAWIAQQRQQLSSSASENQPAQANGGGQPQQQQQQVAAATANGLTKQAPGASRLPQSHQALRARVAAAWDEAHALVPLGALAPGGGDGDGSGNGSAPLAGGRRVTAAAWLAPGRLLLVAAPHAEPGLETGAGDVLVELSVELPEPLLSAADGAAPEPAGTAAVAEVATCYAGGRVLTVAPLPPRRLCLQGRIDSGEAAGGSGSGDDSGGGALLQLEGGALLHFAPGAAGPLPLGGAASFPAPCAPVVPLPLGGAPGAGPAAAVGLGAGGVLYVGSRAVARGVTSFALRWGGDGGPALLYTTRTSVLYTVMLSRLGAYVHQEPDVSALPPLPYQADQLRAAMVAAMRPHDTALAASGPHMRAVEQGARLVAAPAGGRAALLQMPRGNLEAVCPRLLALTGVLCALRRRDYGSAWRVAAKQRADLNLLVDDRWPSFLGDARLFVAAVRDPADLCDLLAALKPGSVLAAGGAYAGADAAAGLATGATAAGAAALASAAAAAANAGSGSGSSGGNNKVAAVCAAVREAVLDLERDEGGSGGGVTSTSTSSAYLKVVVTSHARSDPPDLEAALLAIRAAKDAEAAAAAADGAGGAAGDGASAADAALKHLLLTVDADKAYRAALGLYDASLAFYVISHAQKDPGEYLDELSRLTSSPDPHLARHAIDVHLRRHERALGHLAAAGEQHFDAALAFAERHGLLRHLVALLQADVDGGAGSSSADDSSAKESAAALLPRALAAYSASLRASRRFDDAAVASLAANDAKTALACYAEGGHWQMALALAGRLCWPLERTQMLARELADTLLASGQGAAAATVLRDYLGDADGAVAALAGAKEWREALRSAYAAGRADLVDTLIAPPTAEAAAALLSEARAARDKAGRYLARLRDVRAKRLALRAALEAEAEGAAGGEELDGLGLDGDAASEAPSLISGFSIYTDATTAATARGGSSLASSSAGAAPSTLGGRRAAPKPRRSERRAAKGALKKVKQGSPEEERALREHLARLGPPAHALAEAGQLTELLVALGHSGDARKLQAAVAAWQAEHADATAAVAAMDAEDAALNAAAAAGAGAAGGAAADAGAPPPPQQRQQQQQQQQAAVSWKWDVLRLV